MIYDLTSGDLLEDLTKHGQKVLVAEGGRGGRGNLSFKSSTNRAPRQATKGTPGEERELRLELRLLADVGLIGFPNAGKSSFLSSVSRARPKVADYPFTTLEPHLGVVSHKGQGFVIADLPGLIEGASEGTGLGIKFLKHVARNRVLLHLIEIDQEPAVIERKIKQIRKELEAFDKNLLKREELLVFTKVDLLSESALKRKQEALKKRKLKGFFVSSHSGTGMEKLLDALAERAPSWRENPS